MKKTVIFLLLLLLFKHAHAFSPVRQVQISTNSIPQQSGYYNVAGGTVTNLANFNQISSGTWTVNGATESWTTGVVTGTRFERSTSTFQQGEFSGLRNDNSTTTLIGAVFNGTQTDNSTATLTGTLTSRNVVQVSTAVAQPAVFSVNNSSVVVGASGTPGFVFGVTSPPNTQTNTTGFMGEVIGSTISAGGAAHQITGTWVSIATVTLTAGGWMVSGNCVESSSGGTYSGGSACTISSLPNNTTTDQIDGYNQTSGRFPTTSENVTIPVINIPFTVANGTTEAVYLKASINFTGTPGTFYGNIRAIRSW